MSGTVRFRFPTGSMIGAILGAGAVLGMGGYILGRSEQGHCALLVVAIPVLLAAVVAERRAGVGEAGLILIALGASISPGGALLHPLALFMAGAWAPWLWGSLVATLPILAFLAKRSAWRRR